MKLVLSLLLLLSVALTYDAPTWGVFKKCRNQADVKFKKGLQEYNKLCGIQSDVYKNTPTCQYFHQDLAKAQKAATQWTEQQGEDFQGCMDECIDALDGDAQDLAEAVQQCGSQILQISLVIIASTVAFFL